MIIPRTFRVALAAAFFSFGAILVHAQQTAKVWLMLSEVSQETCFVGDPAEQSRLINSGWRINGEGSLLIKPQATTVGMQRWVKGFDNGNDRIFATNAEQAAIAKKSGYSLEGVMGQVALTQLTPRMIPVYRFVREWRSLWLVDKADQSWAERNGWKAKGIAFWIWPKSSS